MDTHGSGDNLYNPPSGSRTRTTLDVAILQERGIERWKSERNDQSGAPSHSLSAPQTPKIETESLLTAVSLSGDPHRIKNSLRRQHEFDASTGTPSHVHAQPMPISIEDLVWLEQSCDAGAGWTGKELQKRGEVFCAYALRGKRRVAQTVLVRCGQSRKIACRREGA